MRRAFAAGDGQVQELREQRLHDLEAGAGVVLAVGLANQQLVEPAVELGAHQGHVAALGQRGVRAGRTRDGFELGLPCAQLRDARCTPRLARHGEPAVGLAQAEPRSRDRVFGRRLRDEVFGQLRQPLVRGRAQVGRRRRGSGGEAMPGDRRRRRYTGPGGHRCGGERQQGEADGSRSNRGSVHETGLSRHGHVHAAGVAARRSRK